MCNRIRQDIEEGEEHRSDLQGETDETDSAEQPPEQGELEAKRDFWIISGSFIYRHHVQKRRKIARASRKLVACATQVPSGPKANIILFANSG